MNEVKRIGKLLRGTYQERPWHGKSLKRILAGVDAETASAKGIASAHSIWEITLHIESWMEIARQRLGGKVVRVGSKRDWPPAGEISEKAWKRTLESLDSTFVQLLDEVSALKQKELERKIKGKSYDAYTLLHGVINHNVYHSAQISILRKEIANKS